MDPRWPPHCRGALLDKLIWDLILKMEVNVLCSICQVRNDDTVCMLYSEDIQKAIRSNIHCITTDYVELYIT